MVTGPRLQDARSAKSIIMRAFFMLQSYQKGPSEGARNVSVVIENKPKL
jgi:hypothetical protein